MLLASLLVGFGGVSVASPTYRDDSLTEYENGLHFISSQCSEKLSQGIDVAFVKQVLDVMLEHLHTLGWVIYFFLHIFTF